MPKDEVGEVEMTKERIDSLAVRATLARGSNVLFFAEDILALCDTALSLAKRLEAANERIKELELSLQSQGG